MHRGRSFIVFAAAALIAPSSNLHTSEPGDSILVGRRVSLRTAELPGVLGAPTAVARDAGGDFYVASPGAFFRFGSDGTFLGSIGRVGDGPGEYRNIWDILVTPGDTIHVYDVGLGRHTILAPELETISTHPIERPPVAAATVFFGPHDYITSWDVRTPERIGLPLHRVSGGKIVKSFGAEDAIYVPHRPYQSRRLLARDSRGRIWTARINRFRLELRDTMGTRLRTIELTPQWFPPWELDPPPIPESPPVPRVMAIHLDRNDRIWVMTAVPDSEWADGLKSTVYEGREEYVINDLGAVYDTRIDVVDGQTGGLIATARIPEFAVMFLRSDSVMPVVYHQDRIGRPYVDVLQLTLHPGN